MCIRDRLYCLENTIDVDGEYSNDFSDPQKVATYLKVAAKFTPVSYTHLQTMNYIVILYFCC